MGGRTESLIQSLPLWPPDDRSSLVSPLSQPLASLGVATFSNHRIKRGRVTQLNSSSLTRPTHLRRSVSESRTTVEKCSSATSIVSDLGKRMNMPVSIPLLQSSVPSHQPGRPQCGSIPPISTSTVTVRTSDSRSQQTRPSSPGTVVSLFCCIDH